MLKMVTGFVLGSKRSSTYPRGYASGLFLPAALQDNHFEHPTGPMQNTKYILLPYLHIQIPDLKRVRLNEIPTRFHLVTHQDRKDLVHAGEVF